MRTIVCTYLFVWTLDLRVGGWALGSVFDLCWLRAWLSLDGAEVHVVNVITDVEKRYQILLDAALLIGAHDLRSWHLLGWP